MSQDNDSYESRISAAVSEAVMATSQVPGSNDLSIDVNGALRGMCNALATFAATIGQMPEDREQGAKLIEAMEEQVVTDLRHLAGLIRSGALSAHRPERPKPRLVK